MPVHHLSPVSISPSVQSHTHTLTHKIYQLVNYYEWWATAYLACPTPTLLCLLMQWQTVLPAMMYICYAFHPLLCSHVWEIWRQNPADACFMIVQALSNGQEYGLILSTFHKYIYNIVVYTQHVTIMGTFHKFIYNMYTCIYTPWCRCASFQGDAGLFFKCQ